MARKVTKRKKKGEKWTKNELKALELVAQEPSLNNAQISKKMIELGYVRDERYLAGRTNANPQLADKISLKREKYKLQVINQMPSAKKVVDFHIKNKSLPAAKLIYDKVFGGDDDKQVIRPIQVNIGQIQAIITQSMERKVNDINKL